MSTVLLLAQSPEIEALLADLVIFAGYHPVFVRDDETVMDAMRRRDADAILMDASLAAVMVSDCDRAARDRGAAVVYFASTLSSGELREFANARNAACFPLPNGPKLLRAVLTAALEQAGRQQPPLEDAPREAIVSALGAIAQARRLSATARAVRDENQRLREERNTLLRTARVSRDLLQEAVVEYVHILRDDGLPRERVCEVLRAAIRESAEAAGAPELLVSVARDAERWIDEAYRVA